jgi:hypothetical protein
MPGRYVGLWSATESLEAAMIATADAASNRYRVEVSGWDDHKSFFVENSELDWSEEFGKRVTLNRTLAEGSVIFLRLLQPMTNQRAHPVAYEAEFIAKNERGERQFRLRPITLSSWLVRRHVPLSIRSLEFRNGTDRPNQN